MKMTEISRANLNLLQNEFAKELKALGDKYGVTIRPGGGRYGGTSGEVRLRVQVQDLKKAEERAKLTWRTYANWFGFKPEDFGKTFMFRGHRYRIAGCNPNAPKNSIEVERVYDKKAYVMSPDLVKDALSAGGSLAA